MDLYRSKHSDKKYSNRNSSSNDRPSRSFRNSRDNVRQDTTVTCADCGDQCTVPFVPRSNKPVYCSDCFRENKPDDFGRDRYSRDDRGSRYSRDDRGSRYSRDDRGSRYSRDDRGSRYSRDDRQDESTTVTCADCGDQCTIPFVPKTDKPVYCDVCFKQNKPNSRDDRGSRYSRDDRRGESSFRRDSGRNNSKNSRTKSEKFLKKQESFYSNGSAKFNESIKRKLFEILGGKTCYSCGFKDERALSISHINGTQTSNDFGRGSGAASWGKYISAPDVAREELRVLCLNCSAISEPISKPENERPRSKPKRSKYFPR
ncbi:MAG: hypothetical protein EA437_05490 [Candidatus Nitrosomarinus sp.]|nr:MAG: hypothetical protein EA437_05490 [Candidatus Nitrosomarinus sp.]